MKRLYIVLLDIILLVFFLLACARLPVIHTHLLPIDYRFKGGQDGFSSFFRQSMDLSGSEYSVAGNLITKISVDPEGRISKVEIINPLDSVTESEMVRVIGLSGRFWKKCDTITHDDIFYLQMVISTPDITPNYYRPLVERYRRYFTEPVFFSIKDPQSGFASLNNDTILRRMNSLLGSSRYEESMPLVNELIRRDPFNRDLYKVRIMVNYHLERKEEVLSDDNKLMDFAEGYSLDDILKDKGRREK